MAYDGDKVRWENRRSQTAEVVFGEVLYQPGGFCGPRVQGDFQLVVMQSGQGRLTLNETVYPLKTGFAYLLLPGGREYFEFATDKETHHFWCIVRPGAMPRNLQKVLRCSRLSAPCSGLLHSLFDAALGLQPSPDDASQPVLIEYLASATFAEFFHLACKVAGELLPVPAVQAFARYVNAHFGEEKCLAAARRAAGVSRNTLRSKFREAFHTTPARYLWKLRVQRGVAMLIETGQTVAEIGYHCGFKNPFHFSRVLKQQVGYSSTEIRRQGWSEKL